MIMMVSCQKKSPGVRPGLYIVLYFKTYSSRLLLVIVKVAIAIGMICEAFLAYRHNNLPSEDLDEITVYLRSVFPDYHLKSNSYGEILEFMLNDKKNVNGKIGFALPSAIGKCDFNIFLTNDQIIESLNFYADLGR